MQSSPFGVVLLVLQMSVSPNDVIQKIENTEQYPHHNIEANQQWFPQ